MKNPLFRWAPGLSVALPLLALGVSHSMQAAPAHSVVQWRPSFQVASQEAKRAHKPLLVYFRTVWCSPCQILDAKVFPTAGVVAASKKWIPVKVDGDHAGGLDKKYKIGDNYPIILFIKPNGTAISQTVGFQSPALLIKAMNKAYAKSH